MEKIVFAGKKALKAKILFATLTFNKYLLNVNMAKTIFAMLTLLTLYYYYLSEYLTVTQSRVRMLTIILLSVTLLFTCDYINDGWLRNGQKVISTIVAYARTM